MITRTPEPSPLSRLDTTPDLDESIAWLRLGKAEIPPRKLAALCSACDDDPRKVMDANEASWLRAGLTQAQADRLRDCAHTDMSKDLATIDRLRIALLPITDARYPQRLKSLSDAPILLYVRGSLVPDDQFSVAIVGSRRATAYGHSIADRFARELCAYGLCIVSGGARGVDTFAHRGALSAGGRTLAIVGCGLDVAYPAENRKLYADIVATGQGAIVSEYPI